MEKLAALRGFTRVVMNNDSGYDDDKKQNYVLYCTPDNVFAKFH